MNDKISYNLPIWNGVQFTNQKLKISKLEICDSKINGIFAQKSKKVIEYNEEYVHMTPLSGSSYINSLRNKKMNLIKGKISNNHRVLEIGGGDSQIARFIKYKHLTIIDPSLLKEKLNKKNITIYNNFYENIDLKEKYDHIVLFSVIEHVENLEKFFKKINNDLKSGGFIHITTPIIDDQFSRGDFNSLLHEHTYYFTNFGLINLFNKFSFQVIDYEISNDCGYITLKKRAKHKNINNFRKYDLLYFKEIFQNQLIKFKKFTKNNHKLAFYGATNGLNSLIYLTNLNKYNSNYVIIDGDSNKVNKYLPSSMKKILHKKNLKKYKNICISAQSFKDEIIFQNFNISSTFFK